MTKIWPKNGILYVCTLEKSVFRPYFYVKNDPKLNKISNRYWNVLKCVFIFSFFNSQFCSFYVLFIFTNRVSKYWLLVYLFFRHMSCLNKSNMKFHLISSMARCASSSFSVWRKCIYFSYFFRQKSLTRHTLPLMELGVISYLTYLGMTYASKKKVHEQSIFWHPISRNK